MSEALPILERLAVQKPDDQWVIFNLGFCILAKARDLEDPAARKKARARARGYLLRAKELGSSEPVLDGLLSAIPPDGGDEGKFSTSAEVEAAMQAGETAYTHGELDKALTQYARAFELDPKLYEAALFAGDMEFKKGHNSTDAQERSILFDKAGGWFARAIVINPDRETAYRYWGDTLLEYGKNDDARTKFVEALIAEPYNRLSFAGLIKWARQNQVELGYPKIEIPSNLSSSKPGEISITVDELALRGSDNDGSAAWIWYGMRRALWLDKKDGSRSEKFAKAYPAETVYRHSLAEEVDALDGVTRSGPNTNEGAAGEKTHPVARESVEAIRCRTAGSLHPLRAR